MTVGQRFRLYVTGFFKGQIFESSAMMSYYYIFSLSPILILANVILSKMNIGSDTLERFLSGIFPERYSDFVIDYLESISNSQTGFISVSAIILTMYSITRVVKVLRTRIRLLYGNAFEYKSGIRDWIVSFVFSLLLLVSVIISVIILVAGSRLTNWLADKLSFSDFLVNLWLVLRFVIIAAVIFFVLLAIYYVLPGVKQRLSDCLIGTFAGMLGWVIFTYAFSFYVEKMTDYSVVYGSLGAIIALLLWLFFSNTVILGGALINSMRWQRRHEISIVSEKPSIKTKTML